jgi:type IV pilus assembly protein PilB
MRDRNQFISRKYGIPQVDLDLLEIAPDVLALVPSAAAHKLMAIPVVRHGGTLIVAMDDPTNITAVDELTRVTGHSIEIFAAPPGQLIVALQRHYPT